MNRILFALMLMSLCMLSTTTYILADDPPPRGGASSTIPEFPPQYAGRTFEEWRRTIYDLEPETRLKAYPAMAAFARNGYEKESIAAIDAALSKEEEPANIRKGFATAKSLGKLGEPLLIRGLERPSVEREMAILFVLQMEAGSHLPSEALVTALLERAKNKSATNEVRNRALRSLGVQVMAHAFLTPDSKSVPRQQNPAIEPLARQIVPVLEELLLDSDPYVGNAAASSLIKFSLRQPKLMASVLDYLDAELTNPRRSPNSTGGSQITMRRVQEVLPNGGVTIREVPVHMGIQSQNPLSEELWNFHRQPESRDVLLKSLPHLKSLREKHANTDRYLSMIVAELNGQQENAANPGSRPRTRRIPVPVEADTGIDDTEGFAPPRPPPPPPLRNAESL